MGWTFWKCILQQETDVSTPSKQIFVLLKNKFQYGLLADDGTDIILD